MKRLYLGVAGVITVMVLIMLTINTYVPADVPTGKVTEKGARQELTEEEQEFLLKLARDTLENYLGRKTLPEVNEEGITPMLKRVQGCFVTLNKNGNLRGCIGHILPQVPLYKCVIQNAISAALYDTRFPPVGYDELKDIHIEISVLSVPERLDFSSPDDLLDRLRPGIDGVVIRYHGKTSTYLPQVWEMLPQKEEFLSRLCLKQGSPPDCWKSRDVIVETYQAFVFGEQKE